MSEDQIIALLGELQQSGVKINDPGNPGKMYLCGKGITRFSPLPGPARELLEVIRSTDRVASLKTLLGYSCCLTSNLTRRSLPSRRREESEAVDELSGKTRTARPSRVPLS